MYPLLLSSLLTPTATAGVNLPITEAIAEGWEVVVQIEALETACETFSVDEAANRWSRYRTLASVEEVLSWPEDNGLEPLVAGESIEVLWGDHEYGPEWDSEGMSCETPRYSLPDGAIRPAVIRHAAEGWSIDTMYTDDTNTATTSEEPLPPCGEAEQQAIIDAMDSDDTGGGSGDTGDDTTDQKTGDTGCSVIGQAGLAPLTAVFALLGAARRRTRS